MHVVLQLRPHNAGDFLQLGNAQYAEARSGGAESEEDTAEAGGGSPWCAACQRGATRAGAREHDVGAGVI